MPHRITLAELNGRDREGFVAALGHVFERSPWVAAAAWARRPFAGLEELHAAMVAAVAAAGEERQLALIRAHPDLAGRVAPAGRRPPEGAGGRAAAGGTRPPARGPRGRPGYNAAYKERFGFPFVICAREHKKDAILAAFPVRLANGRDDEIRTALDEIAKIAWLRLSDCVAAPSPR